MRSSWEAVDESAQDYPVGTDVRGVAAELTLLGWGQLHTLLTHTAVLWAPTPTLTPVFLVQLHSGSVGTPLYTHTHTQRHPSVPCVSGRCIQKHVCKDRAGVEFSGH